MTYISMYFVSRFCFLSFLVLVWLCFLLGCFFLFSFFFFGGGDALVSLGTGSPKDKGLPQTDCSILIN